MSLVTAYHQHLGLLVHLPLKVPSQNFGYAVEHLYEITRVADMYGSLSLLRIPIEHVLRPLESTIRTSYRDHWGKLLHVASKIQSEWLFHDIACRVIGNPFRDIAYRFEKGPWRSISEIEFIDQLDDHVRRLIVDKRCDLEDMIDRIDHKLLMLKPPKRTVNVRTRSTINLAVAACRNLIVGHIRSHEFKHDWYHKYQTLREKIDVLNYRDYRHISCLNDYRSDFGHPSDMNDEEFFKAFSYLQIRALKLIHPLLKDVVKAPTSQSKKDRYKRGLLCVDFAEAEYPWKLNSQDMMAEGSNMVLGDESSHGDQDF